MVGPTGPFAETRILAQVGRAEAVRRAGWMDREQTERPDSDPHQTLRGSSAC